MLTRQTTRIALLAIAGFAGGCGALAAPFVLFVPEPKPPMVKAEFAGLSNKTVAVLVYADMAVQYDYPYAREELSWAVNRHLNKNVKGVRTIDPTRVVRYQDGDPRLASQSPAQVGRALGADYVLFISLNEFSTRERGSVNLAKGRISANASVWETRPAQEGTDPCVWRRDAVSVSEGSAEEAMYADERQLRLKTEDTFGDVLVKYFYDHRAPEGP
jgi:hypothetical protein